MSNQESVTALFDLVIIQLATLSEQDRQIIQKCRGSHNRLGFAYQLMFVKIFNRYRQQTISEHQQQIRDYLGLDGFDKAAITTAAEAASFTTFNKSSDDTYSKTGVNPLQVSYLMTLLKMLNCAKPSLIR